MAPKPSMGRNARDSRLVILTYDPASTTRERQLMRSNALSHAARVAYERRRRSERHFQQHRHGNNATTENLCTVQKSSKPYIRPDTGPSSMPITRDICHGNSDPFNSMTLEITPLIAHVLSVWKCHYEENPYNPTRWLSRADLALDFSLENTLNANCLVFASATALLSRTPGHHGVRATMLQSRHVCLTQLDDLSRSKSDTSLPIEVANGLLLVFIALVTSDEVIEARKYANQLQKMLKSVECWDSHERISVWCRLYCHDMLSALKNMRPPLLDSAPLIRRWEAFLTRFEQWSSRRLPVPSKIVSPAFTKTLEVLFSRVQRVIDVQCIGPSVSESDDRFLTGSLIVVVELTQSLFDHWRTGRSEILLNAEGPMHVECHYDETATLCAIAFLATAIFSPKMPDEAYPLQCGLKAMQALRHNLETAPPLASSHQQFWKYQHLRLWAYYLGAAWECASETFYGTWYTSQLRQKVKELSIDTWVKLKTITDQFLWVPETHMPGMIWLLGMDRRTKNAAGRIHQTSNSRLAKALFYDDP